MLKSFKESAQKSYVLVDTSGLPPQSSQSLLKSKTYKLKVSWNRCRNVLLFVVPSTYTFFLVVALIFDTIPYMDGLQVRILFYLQY